MLSEYSAVIGAIVGASAAIITSYITLNRQFNYQERQKKLERLEKAHIALSKTAREGSLIQSTAAMRIDDATKYDADWLNNKELVDELRAIIDIYMPHLSHATNELYVELTKFWYEHSMAIANKGNGIELSQEFFNKVVPISETIRRKCNEIKAEISRSTQSLLERRHTAVSRLINRLTRP